MCLRVTINTILAYTEGNKMEWDKEWSELILFMQEGWQLVRSSGGWIALGLVALYVLVVIILIL